MYVLIAKIPFNLEGAEHDVRFYRRLAAKIRQRHPVCAYIYGDEEQVVLAITALAPHPDSLRHWCEKIFALCEREGLGRVAVSGAPLIAHIDRLS